MPLRGEKSVILYDEEQHRAGHGEAIKTPRLFDFAPQGPNKSAQGRGDASYASVAVALGSRVFNV